MIKKFRDGLAFGAGIGVAIVAIWVVVSWISIKRHGELTPAGTATRIIEPDDKAYNVSSEEASASIADRLTMLSPQETISGSQVILLVEYETSDNGRIKAMLADVLKRPSNTDISVEIGKEYNRLSFYPEPNETRYNAALVFFNDSSANSMSVTPIYGTRIPGFGNMPLEQFLSMVAESNTNDFN